ncbi:hypothetical protein TcG_06354 [Trypanosoma cruzi]|nr:hypothetical protein TcG_06354 [Trypanosoma cruzi]
MRFYPECSCAGNKWLDKGRNALRSLKKSPQKEVPEDFNTRNYGLLTAVVFCRFKGDGGPGDFVARGCKKRQRLWPRWASGRRLRNAGSRAGCFFFFFCVCHGFHDEEAAAALVMAPTDTHMCACVVRVSLENTGLRGSVDAMTRVGF